MKYLRRVNRSQLAVSWIFLVDELHDIMIKIYRILSRSRIRGSITTMQPRETTVARKVRKGMFKTKRSKTNISRHIEMETRLQRCIIKKRVALATVLDSFQHSRRNPRAI